MTEKIIDNIISNNLGLYASGKITKEKAIKNIKSLFNDANSPNCPFSDGICTIANDDNTTPCNKCRVSYEYELTSTE